MLRENIEKVAAEVLVLFGASMEAIREVDQPTAEQANDCIFDAVVNALTPYAAEAEEKAAAAKVEADKKAAVMQARAGVASADKSLVGIKYVGKKDYHLDHLYGTGLVWISGQVHNVASSVANKLLVHTDVYRKSEPVSGEAMAEVQDKAPEPPPNQVPLPNFEHMQPAEMILFAQKHYGIAIHPNTKPENMKAKILGLINERGR
jgi:hypothetical protein